MKLLLLFVIVSIISCCRNLSAAEIVVRLVDVGNGLGEKNCYVSLMGGSSDQPRELKWLPGIHFLRTPADGRVRFNLTEPLPRYMSVDVGTFECRQCGQLEITATEHLLRTGAMSGMNGKSDRREPYCHPNLKKLEEVTPKPGEFVIFVRKLALWEKFSFYHTF